MPLSLEAAHLARVALSRNGTHFPVVPVTPAISPPAVATEAAFGHPRFLPRGGREGDRPHAPQELEGASDSIKLWHEAMAEAEKAVNCSCGNK